jgi:predicted short-subunit dehydrogenase-like oxidoreductase (DUF2520 family)
MASTGIAPIGIVGPGRLGQALGRLLCDLGQPVIAIAGAVASGDAFSRTSAAAKFIGSARGTSVEAVTCSSLPSLASRILIAVPDDALPSVARELASAPEPIAAALHTCGSRGPEALVFLEEGRLGERGTSCGVLHPLQTISTPQQGVADLPGSYFGITGSGEALAWALEICGLLRGHALTISAESRPLYHAAAVMASNYLVATIDAALILFKAAGVPEDQALGALAPLIRASVANTLADGPVQALTGPIERGDEQTVAGHLRAFLGVSGHAVSGRAVSESVQGLYRSAGLHTVELARRKSPATHRGIIESLLRKEQEP